MLDAALPLLCLTSGFKTTKQLNTSGFSHLSLQVTGLLCLLSFAIRIFPNQLESF